MSTPPSPDWLPIASAIGGGVLVTYIVVETIIILAARKDLPFKREFLQPLKNLLLVGALQQGLAFAATWISIAGFAMIGNKLAPFHLPDHWSIWIVGFLIYEFWYWVQHWMGHKVRLFWCIHSPHHAPDTMNMLVGSNHHFLESLLYFPFFFGFMTALCGVPVGVILVVSLIDVVWGSFLHISPAIIKRRYGPLEHVVQTPSYHRAHHGKNPLYMDTNYNSMSLFWDYVMGTRQVLRDDEPVTYGITRDVDTTSLMDVQFGEFKGLWRDVRNAPGLANKLRYLFMPPGWSHTGAHKTAASVKAEHGIKHTPFSKQPYK